MDSEVNKISDCDSLYFKNRNIPTNYYINCGLQGYLKHKLPDNKESKILDIGCGFGQTLISLGNAGYTDLHGIDISDEAVTICLGLGLNVQKINDIVSYAETSKSKYDVIIMSHVLEHIEKQAIVNTLRNIKQGLMNPKASLIVMVPNAQSNTGCYWAYEDFTHTTLFTAGSLYYVLKSAGFETVEYIDPLGTEGHRFYWQWLIKSFLHFYRLKIKFWNFVTQSSFHGPSPQIFTYEIKVIAK
jgi:2-polyprenyl-3-methyl-5-hydroxy-6-metoxy-1,4-benzoquinol methylase